MANQKMIDNKTRKKIRRTIAAIEMMQHKFRENKEKSKMLHLELLESVKKFKFDLKESGCSPEKLKQLLTEYHKN